MVTSPLGQDLPLKVNASPDDKDCDLIEFVPSLPGHYRFNITYGGEEVPGSPVMFTVEEAGVARAYGEGLSGGRVGSPVSFKVSVSVNRVSLADKCPKSPKFPLCVGIWFWCP